jgi:hypothetical protein
MSKRLPEEDSRGLYLGHDSAKRPRLESAGFGERSSHVDDRPRAPKHRRDEPAEDTAKRQRLEDGAAVEVINASSASNAPPSPLQTSDMYSSHNLLLKTCHFEWLLRIAAKQLSSSLSLASPATITSSEGSQGAMEEEEGG